VGGLSGRPHVSLFQSKVFLGFRVAVKPLSQLGRRLRGWPQPKRLHAAKTPLADVLDRGDQLHLFAEWPVAPSLSRLGGVGLVR